MPPWQRRCRFSSPADYFYHELSAWAPRQGRLCRIQHWHRDVDARRRRALSCQRRTTNATPPPSHAFKDATPVTPSRNIFSRLIECATPNKMPTIRGRRLATAFAGRKMTVSMISFDRQAMPPAPTFLGHRSLSRSSAARLYHAGAARPGDGTIMIAATSLRCQHRKHRHANSPMGITSRLGLMNIAPIPVTAQESSGRLLDEFHAPPAPCSGRCTFHEHQRH